MTVYCNRPMRVEFLKSQMYSSGNLLLGNLFVMLTSLPIAASARGRAALSRLANKYTKQWNKPLLSAGRRLEENGARHSFAKQWCDKRTVLALRGNRTAA